MKNELNHREQQLVDLCAEDGRTVWEDFVWSLGKATVAVEEAIATHLPRSVIDSRMRSVIIYAEHLRKDRAWFEDLDRRARPWVVGHNTNKSVPVTRHFTQEEAEARIAELEQTDPNGVFNGMYYIDGPSED